MYKVTFKGKPGTTHVVTVKRRIPPRSAEVMILKPEDIVTFEKLPDALRKDRALSIECDGRRLSAGQLKRKTRS